VRRNKIGRCGMSAQWRSMISHDFSEPGCRQASTTFRIA
jgi:hypothetical protein